MCVCTCVCVCACLCVQGWGVTCVYIPLFNTLKCARVFSSVSVCLCLCISLCYICASVAYLSALIDPFQETVCLQQKEDKRKPEKAWSHKDPTICLMLLFWPCQVCELSSCSELCYNGIRKYRVKTCFHMMAFVNWVNCFTVNFQGHCMVCVQCLSSFLSLSGHSLSYEIWNQF